MAKEGQIFYQDCIQNLQILHNLHILHRDIKTCNVGFNEKLNKYVFLDFGFAKIVE